MTRLLTDTREEYALLGTMAFVLVGVTLVDFLITNEVIRVQLSGMTAWTYWSVLAAIVVLVIAPVSLLVWFLENDIKALVVWVFALVVPLVTGTEDLLYYALWRAQFAGSWQTWPWLDSTLVGFSRYATGTQEVTLNGVILSAAIGWVLVALVVYAYFQD